MLAAFYYSFVNKCYFVVLLVDVVLGAAVEVLLLDEEESDEELLLAAALLSPPDFAPPFDDEYRSAYHPPPLNCTAGADSSFSSLPPQCGHSISSGSENFCRFSSVRPQFWHWYSYSGIDISFPEMPYESSTARTLAIASTLRSA